MTRLSIGFISFLFGWVCIQGSSALSCGPCNTEKCRVLSRNECPYGIGKDFCNCCQQCLKGPGESCGGIAVPNGKCGANLVCIGAGLNYGGTCQPKTKCVTAIRCTGTKRINIPGCTIGAGQNNCDCRRRCLKRAGEKCGLMRPGRVPCGPNLECVGEGRERENLGTCLKIQLLNCPRQIFCNSASEKFPENCRYGISKAACLCNFQCKKGPYETCGYLRGNCRSGYICQGHKYTVRNGRYFYTPGRCTLPGACPYRIRCGRRRCPELDCTIGVSKPKCGCCPKCLKGEGERCGIQEGDCERGLTCRGSKVRETRGRPIFTTGVCVRNWSCPRPPPCAPPPPFLKPPKNCRWGFSRAICGCFPICNKGPGQTCGFGGNCGPGYYCHGMNYNRETDEYTDGVCTSTAPTSRYCYWSPYRYRSDWWFPINWRWLAPRSWY